MLSVNPMKNSLNSEILDQRRNRATFEPRPSCQNFTHRQAESHSIGLCPSVFLAHGYFFSIKLGEIKVTNQKNLSDFEKKRPNPINTFRLDRLRYSKQIVYLDRVTSLYLIGPTVRSNRREKGKEVIDIR